MGPIVVGGPPGPDAQKELIKALHADNEPLRASRLYYLVPQRRDAGSHTLSPPAVWSH